MNFIDIDLCTTTTKTNSKHFRKIRHLRKCVYLYLYTHLGIYVHKYIGGYIHMYLIMHMIIFLEGVGYTVSQNYLLAMTVLYRFRNGITVV